LDKLTLLFENLRPIVQHASLLLQIPELVLQILDPLVRGGLDKNVFRCHVKDGRSGNASAESLQGSVHQSRREILESERVFSGGEIARRGACHNRSIGINGDRADA
jgi:hypothetical protein